MVKGDQFDHTFVVSEDVYTRFIQLFDDRNPLHTDKAFAQGKGFKDVVMHGNILNGFLSYFIGELLPDKDVMINAQEIKFINPVYMNDTLEFHAEIAEVYESVNSFVIKYRFQNSQQQKIAKGEIVINKI